MLLDLDESMLLTLVAAVRDHRDREREQQDRWGVHEELLARIAELLDRVALTVVDVSGAKWKSGRPEPLHIIRPGEKPRNVVSMGDMARRLSRG